MNKKAMEKANVIERVLFHLDLTGPTGTSPSGETDQPSCHSFLKVKVYETVWRLLGGRE